MGRAAEVAALIAAVGTLCSCATPVVAQHDGVAGGGSLGPYKVHGGVLADVAGLVVQPGRTMDFDARVVNRGGRVQVVSVAILAVPGAHQPELTHVGLERGRNIIGTQHGWPPDGVRIDPLIGASLPRGPATLAVGITGADPGTSYAAAGVEITYRQGGVLHRATAFGGGIACVATTREQTSACLGAAQDDEVGRVRDYVQRQG